MTDDARYLRSVLAKLSPPDHAMIVIDIDDGPSYLIGSERTVRDAAEQRRDRESPHDLAVLVLDSRGRVDTYYADDIVRVPEQISPVHDGGLVYVAQGPGISIGSSVLLGVFVDDLVAQHACERHAADQRRWSPLNWRESTRGNLTLPVVASPWAGGWMARADESQRARGFYTVTAQRLDATVESASTAPADRAGAQTLRDAIDVLGRVGGELPGGYPLDTLEDLEEIAAALDHDQPFTEDDAASANADAGVDDHGTPRPGLTAADICADLDEHMQRAHDERESG